jgi:polar amino acid transport system permease protein
MAIVKRWKKSFTISILLLVISVISYSILKHFAYNWTWNQVPQYFVSLEKTPVYAEADGTIEKSPDHHSFVLQSGDESIKLTLPKENLLVQEGDRVFTGDLLGELVERKPGPLLQGLWVTLSISFYSTLLGLFLGLLCGLARVSSNVIVSSLSTIYVEAIRGTPLLVQLFIIYFMFGSVFGIESRFLCGVLALGIFSGAYIGEILRAGIQSIHYGQMEAARSLGMSPFQSLRYVILPQVFKQTLPSISGTFISLIKDSSLVSVMALTDLTKAGREIVSSSFMVFETWITVAILYFILTAVFSLLFRKLEQRLSLGGTRK